MTLFKNAQFYIWAVLILLPAQLYAVFSMRTVDMAFWVDRIAQGSTARMPVAADAWKIWMASVLLDVALLIAASVLVQRQRGGSTAS